MNDPQVKKMMQLLSREQRVMAFLLLHNSKLSVLQISRMVRGA